MAGLAQVLIDVFVVEVEEGDVYGFEELGLFRGTKAAFGVLGLVLLGTTVVGVGVVLLQLKHMLWTLDLPINQTRKVVQRPLHSRSSCLLVSLTSRLKHAETYHNILKEAHLL